MHTDSHTFLLVLRYRYVYIVRVVRLPYSMYILTYVYSHLVVDYRIVLKFKLLLSLACREYRFSRVLGMGFHHFLSFLEHLTLSAINSRLDW